VRLLFLDLNLGYVNPTRTLVPAMLRSCGDVVAYGPGYQSGAVLGKGIQAFYDAHGPFDFVIGNDLSIFQYRNIADDPTRLKHFRLDFDRQSLRAMRDIGEWFRRHQGRKIALLFECDAFNVSRDQIATLKDVAGWYVVVWDKRLMESVRDSQDLVHEPYAEKANDNFFEFITDHESRIIAMPHFVSEAEFTWGSLADRRPVWDVPGASYYYRKLARETLGRSGLLGRRFPWMQTYALLARAGLRPYSRALLLTLYAAQFARAIEQSRYCYTCGSAQRMHIRKHFEIPARGAVLVTAPVNGLAAMGFLDGINCFVRSPHELIALHHDLEKDPERAQAVATAGRDLVWSTHRVSSRGHQLRASLDAIRQDAFGGCIWENGCWSVRSH